MEFVDCVNCFKLYDAHKKLEKDLIELKKAYNKFKEYSLEREEIAEQNDLELSAEINYLKSINQKAQKRSVLFVRLIFNQFFIKSQCIFTINNLKN